MLPLPRIAITRPLFDVTMLRDQDAHSSYLDQRSQTQAQAVQNNKISATSITATNLVYPNAESSDGLTESEKRKVRELQARDRQVREHEQAHKVAGGQFASSPTYRTVVGPDGRSYAVKAVRIDTSTVPNNPEATIRKLQIVKRAALAPREPSSADRAVAAEAEQKNSSGACRNSETKEPRCTKG